MAQTLDRRELYVPVQTRTGARIVLTLGMLDMCGERSVYDENGHRIGYVRGW